ncbi:TPR repeat [Streptomyces sp. cf386]|uniref:sel1 repeat family protein n=1 Tax=Streptomyces sp. cf386 TaxID=1761904 RepID=UPI00088C8D9C|nr:sel1 repeat family protein [Streptomyces sp. cf386]SDM82123.1 TPR repeat [Streptomyces sp. cf386]
MATELEELAVEGSAVLLAGLSSENWRRVRNRFAAWLKASDQRFYAGDLHDLKGRQHEYTQGSLAERRWQRRLSEALAEAPDPSLVEEGLRALIKEFSPSGQTTGSGTSVMASGPRSIAAGGDIHIAVIGDNSTATHVAGDHIDFRDSTFHDRVVGVQHNHYGTMPTPAEWQPVGQVRPLEFGVRPTRPVPGLPDVPPYATRDCDKDLQAKLAHNTLVLILGEPCAGKSYTAWNGVRSLRGHRLYAPDPGEDLRPLAAALRGNPGEYVVWLDELTGHLGAGGLDLRLLGRLNDLGAVVLGTMSPAEYYVRRTGTAPGDRVVAAARTVELAREWSEAELARLAAVDDPRAYPAYMWSGREGVASYFALGHHLFDEWQRVGTQLEHPRGQLLVRAAVDLARCGVTGAVSAELLRRVQEQYRAEERESFEEALAWATAPMFGASGLLVAGEEDGTWRAYGALVAEALRSGDLEPVPDEVWWTLLDAAREPDAPLDFASVLDAARSALHERVEAGDAAVALGFARRTEGVERGGWLRRAADAGDSWAAVELAKALLERGDEHGALPYLEKAAEAGSSEAATVLGGLLWKRAEYWLGRAAEHGDGDAAYQFGNLLVGAGRTGAAYHWYTRAAEAGSEKVAARFAELLQRQGDRCEAERWYRRGVAQGDTRAMRGLAQLLVERGDQNESERLLRQAIEAGSADAAVALGLLLARNEERHGEGMALLRQVATLGECSAEAKAWAEYYLAWFMEQEGRTKEARWWYGKAAEHGHYRAKQHLTEQNADRADQPATVKE